MSQPSDVHLDIIPAPSSFSSADNLNWHFGGTGHLAFSDRWTTNALSAVLVLLHRPARPIQLLAPKLAPENLTSPKRKRRPVLLLFLRLDERRRAERLDGLICPEGFMDEWMDGCMHAYTCILEYVCGIRLCHGALSRRPLTVEFSVQSRGQTTLVSRVMAGTSGHGIIVTLYPKCVPTFLLVAWGVECFGPVRAVQRLPARLYCWS